MIIQHNMLADFTSRQHGIIQKNKAAETERLSSGYRINRAADDAAGLSISEKMRGQIRGLLRAEQNVQDGISFIQTGEGALKEVHEMLQRIRELCVQAANDTNTAEDRSCINDEVEQLKEEIQRIFDETQFNTIYIFRAPYQPSIKGNPTDYNYFNLSDGSDPGGVLINNRRYTWDEMGFSTRVSRSDRTFTKSDDGTGEYVEIFVPADTDRSKARRVYVLSANDTGIYVNKKLAASWEDVDVSNNKYSFSYNGMEVSFVVDENTSKDDIVDRLNSDGLSRIAWYAVPDGSNVSAGAVVSSSSAADGNSDLVIRATNTNKDNISNASFGIVAGTNGISVYARNSAAANLIIERNETEWSEMSDITSTPAGDYPIMDWGVTNEGNNPVTLDSSATYRYTDKNTYDGLVSGLSFTYGFSENEVSLATAKSQLSTTMQGYCNAPVKLVSDNSATTVLNWFTTFEFQRDMLNRDFGMGSSSSDNMDAVTISRTRTSTGEVISYEKRYDYALVSYNSDYDGNGNGRWEYADGSNTPVSENAVFYTQEGDDSGNAVRSASDGIFYTSTGLTASSGTSDPGYYYVQTGNGEYKADCVYEKYKYHYEMNNVTGTIVMTADSEEFIDTSFGVRDSDSDQAYGNGGSVSSDKMDIGANSERVYINDRPSDISTGFYTNLYSHREVRLRAADGSYITMYYNDSAENSSNGRINDNTGITIEPTDGAVFGWKKSEASGGKVMKTTYYTEEIGEHKKTLNIQAAANTAQVIQLRWNALTNSVIGIAGINTLTRGKADAGISEADVGIAYISRIRSYFGAMQNRMEHTQAINLNTAENLQASESIIRDANIVNESLAFSTSDILLQAAQAMLSQANRSTQGVISLLQ